jgi:iron complex outermembrane receptor protein
VKDWTYQSFQTRLRSGRLFAQAFGNFSDAGETVLLRTNSPIIDQSRLFAAQIQHGITIGRIDALYGADYQKIDPRTSGTINGRNEDNDNVVELGGYIHTVARLTDRLQFLAAARVDHNDRVEGSVFSPRVALVFKPQIDQTLRLTFNRAFSNPSNFNLFSTFRAATFVRTARSIPRCGARRAQGRVSLPTRLRRRPVYAHAIRCGARNRRNTIAVSRG